MCNEFYVYFYLDPTRNFLPFYVGKGKKGRAYSHLFETEENTENKRKFGRIRIIREKGFEPEVIFWKKELSEDAAYDLEEKMISFFGRKGFEPGGILMNICPDNRPPNPKGKIRSEKHCKSISETKQGGNNPRAVLSNEEAVKIFNDPRPPKEILKDYPSANLGRIWDIKGGRFYAEITGFNDGKRPPEGSVRIKRKLKKNDVIQIYIDKRGAEVLSKEYGVSIEVIEKIKTKEKYQNFLKGVE